MKVKITNVSKKTVVVCGTYLAPKQQIIVDWDTLSDTAKSSVNSLQNLGIVRVVVIDLGEPEPQEIEQVETTDEIVEENKETKPTRRSRKSK